MKPVFSTHPVLNAPELIPRPQWGGRKGQQLVLQVTHLRWV